MLPAQGVQLLSERPAHMIHEWQLNVYQGFRLRGQHMCIMDGSKGSCQGLTCQRLLQ